MCFHYSISRNIADIKEHYKRLFGLDDMDVDDSLFSPIFHANAFAYPLMPVVTEAQPSTVQFFHWGLIPKWQRSREDAMKFRMNTLNARSETVFEKPSFRSSMSAKRCLVPADGFFESMHIGKKTYPYFISLRDEQLFSFAGIHEEWVDNESGEIFKTFSILTHEAQPLLATIHNIKKRQPLMLVDGREEHWLDPSLDKDGIRELFAPIDDTLLHAHTVAKLVHSQRENSNVPNVRDAFVYDVLGEQNVLTSESLDQSD